LATRDIDTLPHFIDLDAARATALRELRAFVALCESLTDADWARPTPCPGWSVRDLIEHVAGVPGYDYFAGRLRHARLGTVHENASNASAAQTGLEPAGLTAVLKQRVAEFAYELDLLTHDDLERQLRVMPGRTQLLRSALGQYVFEFGLHRYDLETAIGNAFELAPEVMSGVVLMTETDGFRPSRVDSYVPRLATPGPEDEVSYALIGETLRWEFSFTPGEPKSAFSPTRNGIWTAGAVYERLCTVSGSDSAICLVLCGRISSHDPLVSAAAGFPPRTFTVW